VPGHLVEELKDREIVDPPPPDLLDELPSVTRETAFV